MLVLLAVVAIAVVVYRHSGEDFTWTESLWLVVITVSSVGLSEHSELSPNLQLFTVGVIVFGLSAAAYTFGGFIQMLTEGEIERALGRRRMTRGIEQLYGHVILCGSGRIGQVLSQELSRQRSPFVIIDNDLEVIEEAQVAKFLVVHGDSTEEAVLVAAGVERAKTLVTSLPSDADNVFITLTARNLNPDLQIISRAEHGSSRKKLLQAGADRVVMPSTIGAHRMARLITRPKTARLMELVIDQGSLEIEMDEIEVSPQSSLVGKTVVEAEAHRKHGLLVVAINRGDGEMAFNPGGDHVFAANDTIIVMGRAEDIEGFRREFRV
jgi:voltage-gated potassium channel